VEFVTESVPELRVRRRPMQERGRVRFEAILTASRQLLTERGMEGFNVEDVAHRAGIPVGSVYQFFPNKFAIVAELDTIDTRDSVEALEASATRFPTQDWQQEATRLVDLIAMHWVGDPSRRAVWLAMRSSSVTQTLADEHARSLVAALLPIIDKLPSDLDAATQVAVAGVIVETCQALLHLSVAVGDPNPAVLTELKRLLRAYLRALVLDA